MARYKLSPTQHRVLGAMERGHKLRPGPGGVGYVTYNAANQPTTVEMRTVDALDTHGLIELTTAGRWRIRPDGFRALDRAKRLR